MEQELFLPTLMHWQYGNNWCGSLKRASFWITPKDEQLDVYKRQEQRPVLPVQAEGVRRPLVPVPGPPSLR